MKMERKDFCKTEINEKINRDGKVKKLVKFTNFETSQLNFEHEQKTPNISMNIFNHSILSKKLFLNKEKSEKFETHRAGKSLALNTAIKLVNLHENKPKVKHIKRFSENLTHDIDPLISCYFVDGFHQNSKLKSLSNSKNYKESIMEKYKIDETITEKDKLVLGKMKVHKEISETTRIKKIIRDEHFKNHYKSFKSLKINYQIYQNVTDIVNEAMTEAYLEKYENEKKFKVKVEKMPKIKISFENKKSVDFSLNLADRGNKIKHVRRNSVLSREEFLNSLLFQGILINHLKNKPKGRTQATISVISDTIYLIGGLSDSGLNDIWKCNVSGNFLSWNRINFTQKEEILGRFGHTSNVFKETNIIIIGGQIDESNTFHNESFIFYDTNKNHIKIQKCVNKSDFKHRRNHISETIGNLILVHGGIDEYQNILDDCWLLDPVFCRWIIAEIKGSKSPKLYFHSSALVLGINKRLNEQMNVYKFPENQSYLTRSNIQNEGIYIYGGINENSQISNELKYLRIGKKPLEWVTIRPDGIGPKPNYGVSLSFYEELKVLILAGGRGLNDIFSDEVFFFDLERNFWKQIKIHQNQFLKRAQHSAGFVDNKLIIFGGINETSYLGSDIYIISVDSWEKKTRRLGILNQNEVSATVLN